MNKNIFTIVLDDVDDPEETSAKFEIFPKIPGLLIAIFDSNGDELACVVVHAEAVLELLQTHLSET